MKSELQDKRLLHDRLTGYAAAAGALVSLVSGVDAQVVYSGPKSIDFDHYGEYIEIDMNNDLVNDFGFQFSNISFTSMGGPGFFAQEINFGAIINPRTELYQNSWITKKSTVHSASLSDEGTIIKYGTAVVDGLEPGELINSVRKSWSDTTDPSSPGILGLFYHYYHLTTWSYYINNLFVAGEFSDDEKFVGVRFFIGNQQHYGWIRVNMGESFDSLTIVDWAYESTPETGMVAGDGLGIDLPPNLYITGGTFRTNESTRKLTMTASKEITGFEVSDIVITNGSSENFTEVTLGMEFTFEVTASQEGTVIVEIPDSVVLDLTGHPNSPSNTSWCCDLTGPVPEFFNYPSLINDLISYTHIKFNEKIEGLTISDFIVPNAMVQSMQADREGIEYTLKLKNINEGDITLELGSGTVIDLAGNPNIAGSVSWIYDITGPDITLDAGVDTTSDTLALVDILFSEPASGLDILNIDVYNGWESALETITEDLHYVLSVYAFDSAHVARTIEVKIFPGRIQDYAGNPNETIASVSWLYQPVGLNPSSDEEIKIYPNPVKDNLHIKLAGYATIKLIDLRGNVVYSQENALDEIIDVGGFTPGVYVVQIQDNEKVTQYKIIIE